METNVTSNKLFSNTNTHCCPRQPVTVSVTQCNTTYLSTVDCNNQQLSLYNNSYCQTWLLLLINTYYSINYFLTRHCNYKCDLRIHNALSAQYVELYCEIWVSLPEWNWSSARLDSCSSLYSDQFHWHVVTVQLIGDRTQDELTQAKDRERLIIILSCHHTHSCLTAAT